MTDPDRKAALLTVALTAAKVSTRKAEAARQLQETTQAQRDARIVAAAEQGATYKELAAATGLSYDRVKQILAAARND